MGGQGPGDCAIATADNRVINFLAGPVPENWEKQSFSVPEQILEGKRTDTLVRLVGSLKGKGLSDEAIRVAVKEENANCSPPLTDRELEQTVFPALSRNWPVERSYKAVPDRGRIRITDFHLDKAADVEILEPEWLIPGMDSTIWNNNNSRRGWSGKDFPVVCDRCKCHIWKTVFSQ